MSYAIAVKNDDALLTALREATDSNSAAANEFVRKHQKFVYSTALRYLKSSDDAYDATQEVFIKALKSIKNFRGESSITTWLYRITQNVCSGMKRKEKVRQFVGLDVIEEIEADHGITPAQVTENNDFRARFEGILSQLPEKQRETFISQTLGTSVGGLKANYFQAVKKLAHLLKEEKR
jgi:RNA polymerase sigma-70 factor, ECF subfamily